MCTQRKLLSLVFALILALSVSVTSFAESDVSDMTQKGSIELAVKDTESGNYVSEGSITIYQVAYVDTKENSLRFSFTDDFKACNLSLENLESAQLPADLAAFASSNSLIGKTQSLEKNGYAVFNDLELGLYLAVQSKSFDRFAAIKPFLVSVPFKDGDNLIYDVKASPKAGTLPSTFPAVSSSDKDIIDTPNIPTLPQTGQLWWPIPVLAAMGLLFLNIGFIRRRYEKVK